MNILVCCEESQAITKCCFEKGYNVFSCDLQNCSGGLPGRHIKGDCLPLLNGYCSFTCENGDYHELNSRWDLIIAHPPCTYLTFAGNQCFSEKLYSYEYILDRLSERIKAIEFFYQILKADCDYIAVENPKGVMNTVYHSATQIIQPYQFSKGYDDIENYHTKATCFWLKNLPPLCPTNLLLSPNNGLTRKEMKKINFTESLARGSVARSKTFPGVADAIVSQWCDYVNSLL